MPGWCHPTFLPFTQSIALDWFSHHASMCWQLWLSLARTITVRPLPFMNDLLTRLTRKAGYLRRGRWCISLVLEHLRSLKFLTKSPGVC